MKKQRSPSGQLSFEAPAAPAGTTIGYRKIPNSPPGCCGGGGGGGCGCCCTCCCGGGRGAAGCLGGRFCACGVGLGEGLGSGAAVTIVVSGPLQSVSQMS